jgi:hypothetical protein
MPRHLGYAKKCKAEYSSGEEVKYISCILEWAQFYALRYPRGEDKDVVMRATEALVRLQTKNLDGVSGQKILDNAGFISYKNSNSNGLWPWLEEFGGLPVVSRMPDRRYLISDLFLTALRAYFAIA